MEEFQSVRPARPSEDSCGCIDMALTKQNRRFRQTSLGKRARPQRRYNVLKARFR
jgi:hypothetical protein